MQTAERIQHELVFHDKQASERAAYLLDHPGDLVVEEHAYLNHASWIRPALSRLGDLRHRDVLDFGCGHGMAAVVLARRGARVTAFDLSGGYVREAQARATASGAAIRFVQANGERLPFADQSFDCIWGNAVLHHLQLARAASELARVLRPEGVAIFCEPWGGNPLLNWARRHLPYPGKKRTPNETPLQRKDLRQLADYFDVDVEGHQLLSMVSRVVDRGRLTDLLTSFDGYLLKLPGVKWLCRYAVITLRPSLASRER